MKNKPAVKEIQGTLNSLGYPCGAVDGVIGTKTTGAFSSFLIGNGFKSLHTVLGPVNTLTITGPLSGAVKEYKKKTVPLVTGIPWVDEGLTVLGLREGRDNKTLSTFLRSDGRTVGDPNEIPWCADFVQTAIANTLPNEGFNSRLKTNPYLARNWLDFGHEIKSPSIGAVMVFWRKSPDSIYGHVAFYMGEDDEAFHILGGNQSDSISITRLSKHRLRPNGIRWPSTSSQKPRGRRFLTADGEISLDER